MSGGWDLPRCPRCGQKHSAYSWCETRPPALPAWNEQDAEDAARRAQEVAETLERGSVTACRGAARIRELEAEVVELRQRLDVAEAKAEAKS